ncbi:MAG: hypothetical protein KKA67_05625 [Spirochaetes bacterium]|nr:hypothetical protein [Spirochaetota bacterium]MBU1079625.1 hypothetical protein [Spirochaetota bacterium]
MDKKIKAIPNKSEYDEPPAKPFELPALADDMRVEFLQSDDLETIEEGIKTIDRTTGMLRIIQGLAILKAESLWDQSGLSSLQYYRQKANERLGMSRASVSNLRKIAYAWTDNVKMLRNIDLSGKAVHLLYLDAALQRHQDKKLVLEHLKADSARDFAEWARGMGEEPEELVPDIKLTYGGGRIALDGKPFLEYDEALPDDERSFIGKLLKAGYKARQGNCIAHVVPVYDDGEARAVDNFLKKHRAGK